VLATVVMPTTGDRSAVLPHAVGSVLRQTVADLELFVIGDGAAEPSRAVIRRLQREDPRIRFFDHDKGARRGEPYRHAALAEARGRIVAYLCDRDLMFPWHLQALLDLLEHADFAHTLRFHPLPDGRVRVAGDNDIARAADRRDVVRGFRAGNGMPLSTVGHTLAMYRRLPHGWRTTPPGHLTDFSMWQQFLAHADCRAASGRRPTVLTFYTHLRTAWSMRERADELERWQRRMAEPGWYERLLEELVAATVEGLARPPRGRPMLARLRQSRLASTLNALPVVRAPARWVWRRVKRTPGFS
jgi:hypothetical protein